MLPKISSVFKIKKPLDLNLSRHWKSASYLARNYSWSRFRNNTGHYSRSLSRCACRRLRLAVPFIWPTSASLPLQRQDLYFRGRRSAFAVCRITIGGLKICWPSIHGYNLSIVLDSLHEHQVLVGLLIFFERMFQSGGQRLASSWPEGGGMSKWLKLKSRNQNEEDAQSDAEGLWNHQLKFAVSCKFTKVCCLKITYYNKCLICWSRYHFFFFETFICLLWAA